MFIYKAACPVGCFNGGNCSSPGICTCPSMWSGNDCRQGIYLRMLNKNTLGVKKCETNQKQHCKEVQPKTLISRSYLSKIFLTT